ncbi:lipopolysaccharide assembly protein LapA domain-containing protein [Gordonia otitidis]|uniref:Lipopolysaccharide assembly protein A domain-containing protein n=1 Tax=Gordonia otitidis (strain DSM 44809 / CCUG 52243 / JCM 12355 / NBRC 100426 / IFM 10032) TaxID=1108044 RepID=H5TI75_GORO1|nr:LapA family protein [Gordonia otitidis]UEA59167.1 LapA family protein [Gordonia otitidis]GAB33183.1 hypothetical protein GOOTI_048_00110 [Gordonia otitidis NBRC 100426]
MSAGTSSTTGNSTPSTGQKALALAARNWVPIVLIVVGIIFIAQNTQHVRINFLAFHVGASLWLILTIVAVAGVVAGWFIGRNRLKRK